MSYLAAGEILIPAASYYENEMCRSIIDELQPLFDEGDIRLIVGAVNLRGFFDAWFRDTKRPADQFLYPGTLHK